MKVQKLFLIFGLVAILILLCPSQSSAARTTTSDLYSYCKNAEQDKSNGNPTITFGLCVGYVSGFLDMVDNNPIFRVKEKFYGLQMVKNITNGEAIILFVKYATTHPEAQNYPADGSLFEALVEAKVLAIVPVVENSQIQ